MAALQGGIARRSKFENGWVFTTKTGLYGTDYLQRALVTAIGLGANRPQDAVYPTSRRTDADGKPYSGANKYVMHFDKGQTAAGRTASGRSRCTTPSTSSSPTRSTATRSAPATSSKTNADGSVDLYIQNESPGKDKEANWLRRPKDKFVLMLRLYWPKENRPSILDGTWKIPRVGEAR